MKKYICIFMMSWLPCFMVAANAMGMKMALENASVQSDQPTEHAQISCHEKVNHDQTSGNQPGDNSTSQSTSHHCTFCAFCVVGSAMSATPTMKMTHVKTSNINLASLDVAFTSQDYPPAIKPPILN